MYGGSVLLSGERTARVSEASGPSSLIAQTITRPVIVHVRREEYYIKQGR